MHRSLEDGDATSGTLVCKLSQRKAALLGLDQPAQIKMDLISVNEHLEESSTENLRRVLTQLRDTSKWSPEQREQAAEKAEQRAKFLRGQGPDPDAD